jgi:hypothetical protein
VTERDHGQGNTDAPRVDTDYGERRSNDSGGSGPRRVKDVRTEQGGSDSRYASASTDRGTSWLSVVLGWLAALGAGLILSGIVSGIVGAIFGTAGRQGITEGGTTALVGLLVTLLLAFLIGGYVAGRLASRSGFKHGLLVPLLALVVTIVLAIVGGLVGVSFIDQLSGVTLPQGAQSSAQQAAPQQGLGTILTVGGILALLVPFIGGAIGGAWGARTGRRRP